MAQTFKRSEYKKSDENVKFISFFRSLNKENQLIFIKADPAVKNLLTKKMLANFKHNKKN